MRGKLITFESGEDAGKTTQIKILRKRLENEGHKVHLFREPGGTNQDNSSDLGEYLRTGIKDSERFPDLDNFTIICMFMSQRRYNLNINIKPYIESGHIVIADRWKDSSPAYQGKVFGTKEEEDLVNMLNEMATKSFLADITFLFDGDPKVFQQRKKAGGKENYEDRFDNDPDERHYKTRQAYLHIAALEPDRFRIIDAERSIDDIATDIYSAVSEILVKK